MSRSLELLSPKSKVDARAQTCASSMSPESREDLANIIHENSLIDFTKSIGKKLDKLIWLRKQVGNIIRKGNLIVG